jgi:hypothetical protein
MPHINTELGFRTQKGAKKTRKVTKRSFSKQDRCASEEMALSKRNKEVRDTWGKHTELRKGVIWKG